VSEDWWPDDLKRDFEQLCKDVDALAERIERVRELRARRGRDLSPETRAQAERLVLEGGRLMAVLLAGYTHGEG
jgi:hypothetical protein